MLLDPACGRGTSLNRAVVYGMDAHGIELDQRDVEAYTTFILTWMKDKRLKHQLEQAKLRKGRDTPAHRITVTYGRGKDRSAHRVVDIVHDDTLGARTPPQGALDRRPRVRPPVRRAARLPTGGRPVATAARRGFSARRFPCGPTCSVPVVPWRWPGTATPWPGPRWPIW